MAHMHMLALRVVGPSASDDHEDQIANPCATAGISSQLAACSWPAWAPNAHCTSAYTSSISEPFSFSFPYPLSSYSAYPRWHLPTPDVATSTPSSTTTSTSAQMAIPPVLPDRIERAQRRPPPTLELPVEPVEEAVPPTAATEAVSRGEDRTPPALLPAVQPNDRDANVGPRSSSEPQIVDGSVSDTSTATVQHADGKPKPRSRRPKPVNACWMCHKAFDRPSTLRKHLLVHTGEKSFQCELCARRFGVQSNLNRHRRRCLEKHSEATATGTTPASLPPTAPRRVREEPNAETGADDPSRRSTSPSPTPPKKKRKRTAASTAPWVPASLADFSLAPDPREASLPLPPVTPFYAAYPFRSPPTLLAPPPSHLYGPHQSESEYDFEAEYGRAPSPVAHVSLEGTPTYEEERDSYADAHRYPYSDRTGGWTGRLPGPAPVGGRVLMTSYRLPYQYHYQGRGGSRRGSVQSAELVDFDEDGEFLDDR